MAEPKLPSWAKLDKNGKVEVDPDVVYPLFLDALEYPGNKPTRTQLETARRCLTEVLKVDYEIGPFTLRILKRERWALKNFDLPDDGGNRFRREYERIKREKKIPE